MHTHRSDPFVPAAGLISAALVTEARAHEHVLVDASAQAVDVGRHLVPGLRKGQNQLQSLDTVSGVIPPDTGSLLTLVVTKLRVHAENNRCKE